MSKYASKRLVDISTHGEYWARIPGLSWARCWPDTHSGQDLSSAPAQCSAPSHHCRAGWAHWTWNDKKVSSYNSRFLEECLESEVKVMSPELRTTGWTPLLIQLTSRSPRDLTVQVNLAVFPSTPDEKCK